MMAYYKRTAALGDALFWLSVCRLTPEQLIALDALVVEMRARLDAGKKIDKGQRERLTAWRKAYSERRMAEYIAMHAIPVETMIETTAA